MQFVHLRIRENPLLNFKLKSCVEGLDTTYNIRVLNNIIWAYCSELPQLHTCLQYKRAKG